MATKTKEDRVTVRATKKAPAKLGTIANPLRKDLQIWLNAGWEEVKEAAKAS